MTYQEKSRKIFGAEEWKFPVPPNLSDLTERPDLGVAFKFNNPEVSFARFTLADGNILIQDCTPTLTNAGNDLVSKSLQFSLNDPLSFVTSQVVDAMKESERLLGLIGQINPDKTLIIYPGNGAKTVKDYIQASGTIIPDGIFIPTRRTSLGKGKFEIEIEIEALPTKKPREILVIDDVVASGQTSRALACSLIRRYGTSPVLKLACWIMLSSADLDSYYQKVYSSTVIQPNYVSRPPINSLSCLISENSKYDLVKKQYCEKYLNKTDFLEQIKTILESLKEKK